MRRSRVASAWLPFALLLALAPASGLRAQGGAGDPDAGRPYDILDYAKTAEAATKTAAELRSVLAELKALTGGDHLPNALQKMTLSADATIENTSKRVLELTNHVFWRAVQLVGVLLVAFVTYRMIATRIKSSVTPTAGG